MSFFTCSEIDRLPCWSQAHRYFQEIPTVPPIPDSCRKEPLSAKWIVRYQLVDEHAIWESFDSNDEARSLCVLASLGQADGLSVKLIWSEGTAGVLRTERSYDSLMLLYKLESLSSAESNEVPWLLETSRTRQYVLWDSISDSVSLLNWQCLDAMVRGVGTGGRPRDSKDSWLQECFAEYPRCEVQTAIEDLGERRYAKSNFNRNRTSKRFSDPPTYDPTYFTDSKFQVANLLAF